MFPELRGNFSRRAANLSGGERQMLALSTILLVSPRLVLLDEPTLGLARPLVRRSLERIQELRRQSGTGIIIVEHKVREVLEIADRVYVFRSGKISFSGTAEVLRSDNRLLREVYL
jgi:branched-chain amino acid transport system ATP-binding protein